MTKKHNKKRNVGIVYEQLLRYISTKIIENRQDMSKKAVNILEKRFNKETEIYKEFRLVNALVNSTVSGTHIAAGILTEAKQAARNIDQVRLMKEKSLLIKDINHNLNESTFFHKKINKYKEYATVQILINEWTKKDRSDLAKQIEYEKLVVEHLVSEKVKPTILDENKSDRLVFKVMSKKINEKYGNNLSREQKDIIRNYAIYDHDPHALSVFLENLKLKTLKQLDSLRDTSDNSTLLSKIDLVYENVTTLASDIVDDETIKKFLTVSNLKEQLLRSEK
jgi:hypothetical protein